jgi:hypothetical protein
VSAEDASIHLTVYMQYDASFVQVLFRYNVTEMCSPPFSMSEFQLQTAVETLLKSSD